MGILKRLRCPHSNLRGIYGDEIIMAGYRRLRCLDCRAYLDGPVILARLRDVERELDGY